MRGSASIESMTVEALLSPEEQIELGRQVKALVELAESKGIPVKIMKADGVRQLTMSATKEEKIIIKKGLAAREKYVLANTGLIGLTLKRILQRNQFISHMEKADLFQEGVIGLYKAVENFDSSLGYRFSTYAVWWIKQEIERAIQRSDTVVSVPGSSMRVAWEIETKVSDIRIQCQERFTPMPTYAELADRIGKTPKQISSAMMARRATRCEPFDRATRRRGASADPSGPGLEWAALASERVDLRCTQVDGDFISFADSFGASSQMLEQLDRRLKMEQIVALSDKLPETERLIFRMRFGIECNEHSFKQIKDATGFSEKEAKEIIKSCVARIKFCLES
jgi:RNA polymerase sigma factor (sigma-70 family)